MIDLKELFAAGISNENKQTQALIAIAERLDELVKTVKDSQTRTGALKINKESWK